MAKSARQARLEQGEALGKLRPEHQAELNAMRAQSGGASGGKVKIEANDRKAVQEASLRAEAAGKSLRLYDSVAPAIERFNPGPLKGSMYDMVMPNEGGGFFDSVGAIVGAPVRALLPAQDKDDYQRINSARAERIGLRSMEQKGVMAKNDEMQFKAADISASKGKRVNADIVARQRMESNLTRIRSTLEQKWVSRFGSTSRAAPNGKTFAEIVDFAERDFMKARGPNRPKAPPSTRRAQGGWSAEEVK